MAEDPRLAAFLRSLDNWTAALPRPLRSEDPRLLLRLFLRLLGPADGDGISQVELIGQLNIKQSRASKLTRKLADLRWIWLQKDRKDRRVKMAILTPRGRQALAAIADKLAPPKVSRRARQRASQASSSFSGEPSFLDLLNSTLPETPEPSTEGSEAAEGEARR